ncbi:MAG TPA: DMT family transporter [Bacteroidales bacterium]|nr:DMT family transporter [Bacteroidales bacterium]
MERTGRKELFRGSLAVGLAAMLWGFDGVVLTPQLYRLDVVYVVFILHLVPFLFMNVLFWKSYRSLRLMSATDLLTFTLIGLFGGAIGTIAIVKALFLLNFNHLSVVVLLQKLQPVFAIALAAILLKEKISRRYAFWSAMAIISGYFLTFGWNLPDFKTGSNTIYASLLALLAAFSFGSSTVFSKKVLYKYPFTTSTFYRYGFTTAIMFIFMLLFGDFGQIAATGRREWFFILLIGLTTGSGAIFLYYYGLRRIKAMTATISELLFPVSAVVFDYLINGSILSPLQWFSAALMVFAIIRLNTQFRES